MPFGAVFNWLFRRSGVAQTPGAVAEDRSTYATSDLARRVSELERHLAEIALIRVEWTEVLDKLQAWTNRQNARDAKRLRAGLETLANSPEDAPGPTNGEAPTTDPGQLKIALRQRLRAQQGGRQ